MGEQVRVLGHGRLGMRGTTAIVDIDGALLIASDLSSKTANNE